MITFWQEKKKWLIGIGGGLLLAASLFYYYSGSGQGEMIPVNAAVVEGKDHTGKAVHTPLADQVKQGQPAGKAGADGQAESGVMAGQGTKKIVVDIKGAVAHPGVYTLVGNARLYQLVDMAGGLLSQADRKQVNEAAPLQDGTLIYIPIKGEAYIGPASALQAGNGTGTSASLGSGPTAQGGALQDVPVNINRATLEELQKIPGIGPSRAASIMQYRQEHNGFKTVDDLRQISGIGPKTLEKLRPHVCVQ